MSRSNDSNKKGFLESFRTRSFRVGGYSVTASAIVLAIAVLLNVIVNALPMSLTQIDTSFNQLFSISDQTTKRIGALKQDVEITWIAREGTEDETIGKLLDRYKNMSKHISVKTLDPDIYPTVVQQYTDSASNNSLVVVSGERSRYLDYYEIYEHDYEYSEYYYNYTVTDIRFAGESVLTSAIHYVTSESIPKVYVLVGHGEIALPDWISTALNRENIETVSLTIPDNGVIPEDADAIMLCDPQQDLTAEERDGLLAYLKAGGKMFFISAPLQEGSLPNLSEVLAYYGVRAAQGIVIETDQSHFVQGMPFCLMPALSSHGITDPLTTNNYRVMMTVAHGLTVDENLRSGLSVTELMTTSEGAFCKTAGYALKNYDKEEGDLNGPFALGVAISEAVGEEETQIVWLSSTMIFDENMNQQISGGNLNLFLNSVNWMCQKDENTLTIRAKSLADGYLTLDGATVTVLSLVIVGVIPLTYLCIGIVTWLRRRRK